MNILVTGGAGYIGTELIYSLVEEPRVNKIVVYDNLVRNNHNIFLGRSKLRSDKVEFIRADILDSRRLKKEVDQADIVYHLAAKVTTPFADHSPHEFDQVNNWGTAELTSLIEKSNVSKFIYASSLSVYGSSDEALDVGSPLNPKTFYGISKRHGEEHLTRLQKSPVKVYVLRLGNVYGYSKSMRFDSVINKFVFEANFTNRIKIFGDGNQVRSFIHIDRLSDVLTRIGLEDLSPETYNVVENTFSINTIVEELNALFPTLETIYVNQNWNMRSLNVNRDQRLNDLMVIPPKTLRSDLKDIKNRFTF
jgi:UDP-glucose 4-epimerase